MKRELVEALPNGDMLVVDIRTNMFGVPFFTACLITTELRPTTVCKTLATDDARDAAIARGRAALSPHDQKREG